MNRVRRTQTLEALGITTWSRRDAAEPPPKDEHVVIEPASIGEPVARAAGNKPAPAAPPQPELLPQDSYTPPSDWAGLREAVSGCTRCKLCHTRTNTVFGVGPEDAPLLVIGEGPGADEDARGEPFVGRAGRLLDEMLKAIGRSRQDNTFIANVVKCRPPGNRDPEADEVAACRPYLEQQIRLLKPRLIVGLGRVAAQRLLKTDLPMSKLRGGLHHYAPQTEVATASADSAEGNTPVMLTYHPAYLLRSPREKAKVWQDLKQIHRFLEPPA